MRGSVNIGHKMGVKKGCALGCVGLVFAWGALMTLCTRDTLVRWWPKTRTPPLDMYNLMIDVSVFPQGWYPHLDPDPIPKRERGERESLYAVFRYEGLRPGVVGAYHRVYRYRNEVDAAAVYPADFAGREFPEWDMITPWAEPEEWSYESPVADRFKFSCGEMDILGRFWRCKAVAQYDEFISVFGTDLSPNHMTLEQLELVLVAIDAQMALHVGITE